MSSMPLLMVFRGRLPLEFAPAGLGWEFGGEGTLEVGLFGGGVLMLDIFLLTAVI